MNRSEEPRGYEPASRGPWANWGLATLDRMAAQHQRRRLETQQPSNGFDLSHNDYLGLRHATWLQEIARDCVDSVPCGSGGSRLLGGDHQVFHELESKFAAQLGVPAALYFGSGYAANEGLLSSLAGPGVTVFYDELCHASMIDGLRLTGLPRSRRVRFGHNNLTELAEQLDASNSSRKLVVVESIYSMDGDGPDVHQLLDVCRNHNALLIVDEAHATGVLGPRGLGRFADCGATNLVTVHTCGKAWGLQGAFVAGERWLIDLLINKARAFIYTTAPTPLVAAILNKLLDQSDELLIRRQHLQEISESVWRALKQQGWRIGPQVSHIQPIVIGAAEPTIQASKFLADRGWQIRAIRPPTVPKGTARLRLSLNATLTRQDCKQLIADFADLRREGLCP